MTNTMKEFTAAKMLTAAIKKVMGEHYDNDRTVVANVTSLMRGEKEVKSDFQSPTDHYKDQNMAGRPMNSKARPKPKPKKVATKSRKKGTKKA